MELLRLMLGRGGVAMRWVVWLGGWLVALAIIVAWVGSESHWLPLPDSPAATVLAYTTDDVNIRSAPSLDGDILGIAVNGTELAVFETSSNGFRAVEFAGGRAWVAEDYLAINDFASTTLLPRPAQAAPAGTDVPPAGGDPVEAPPAVTGGDNARPTMPDTMDEPTGERWIDVDRTTKTVTLYIGDRPQQSFVGKLGRDPSVDGFYATAVYAFADIGMRVEVHD